MLVHSRPRPCFPLLALAFLTASCIGIYRASPSALAFTPNSLLWNRYDNLLRRDMTNHENAFGTPCGRLNNDGTPHPSTLPGDPSLILTTNLDLKDKKVEIMKGKHLGRIVNSNETQFITPRSASLLKLFLPVCC
jgi:hypothetical protein